ncbi:MAG TPA: energy-coupling factor transporter ATPase, partial [Lachnospiraceae bacterium]|nr:energy-coupling factor transporter ATPase [Lachnospiraceae bacterium]
IDKLEAELRAYEALKAVGIGDDLLDASPFELSGGQKRRVAIA